MEGRDDVKRLQGLAGYRLRIGEYRVIVDEDRTTILTLTVGRLHTTTYKRGPSMTAVQFIVSPSGDELAVIPRSDYERIVALASEAMEDAADAAAYVEAKAEWEADGRPIFPPELSALLLKNKSRLAAVRNGADYRKRFWPEKPKSNRAISRISRLVGRKYRYLSRVVSDKPRYCIKFHWKPSTTAL